MLSFKKLISGAAILACLALPQKTNAEGSAELMAGDKSTAIDLKVSAEIAPGLELFFKNLITAKYKNKVDYFGFISLGYNVWGGLNALVQVQFIPDMGVSPRFGLEYFKEIGDVSIYGEAVSIVQKNPQVELLASSGYKPQLTEDISFVASLEAITTLSQELGHDFSTQRLRLGLGTDKFEFGPAVNFEESDGSMDYNLGGSVKVNF